MLSQFFITLLNVSKFSQDFMRGETIPNFWSQRHYAFITKANLIGFRNVKIKSVLTTNRSIIDFFFFKADLPSDAFIT